MFDFQMSSTGSLGIVGPGGGRLPSAGASGGASWWRRAEAASWRTAGCWQGQEGGTERQRQAASETVSRSEVGQRAKGKAGARI